MLGFRISLNSQTHQSQVNSSELPAIPSTLKAMVHLAKSLLKPWQESPSQMLPLAVAGNGEITELQLQKVSSPKLRVVMDTRVLMSADNHPRLVLSRLSSGSWSTEKVIMPHTGTSRMDQPFKSPQASDCGRTKMMLPQSSRLMLSHSPTNCSTSASKSHRLKSSCLMKLMKQEERLVEKQAWKSPVPLLLLLWVLQLLPLSSSLESESTIFSFNGFIRNGQLFLE